MASPRFALLAVLAPSLALSGCLDLSRHETRDPALLQRVAELRAQSQQKPEDVNLLVDLGEAQDEANQTFDAADTLLLATQKDPKSVRARAALATVYLSMGYAQSAVTHLRECMQLDRQNPDCLFAVGTLFEGDQSKQGLQEARRAYRQILALAPSYRRANLVKSRLDQLESRLGPDTGGEQAAPGAQGGETAEGEHDHADGAPQGEMPPGHPPVDQGATAQGAQGGDQLPPGHPPTDGTAAQNGQPAPAIPGHPSTGGGGENVGQLNEFGATLKRAFDAVKKGDAPAAEAAFDAAAKLRPNDPTALAGLAQSRLAQGKFGDALVPAEQALAADPNDVQARYTAGLALIRSGKDVARGVALWEALQKDDPEYAKQVQIAEQLAEVKGAKPAAPASGAKKDAKPSKSAKP